uniref:Uncharacterized protein n=1 Tax=mine drainage metagenome TaxID=410659 RepID=E6PD55_9ZZZZ
MLLSNTLNLRFIQEDVKDPKHLPIQKWGSFP